MGEDFPLDPSQVQPPEDGEHGQPQGGGPTHIEVTSHESDSQLGDAEPSAQPDPNRPRTAEELTQDFDSEVSKPDSELAIQSVDNQISDVEKQRESNDRSIAFTRTYKPTPPGPRPHPEAGGMDHQDYDVETWEYHHYDRSAELDELDAHDEELYERIDELEDLRKKVENGDATLVEKFSLAEKTRLETEFRRKIHEADRKVFDYDTRRGVELVGSRKLLTSVEGLLGSVGKDGQPKNSEWQHSHTDMQELDDRVPKVAMPYWYDKFVKNEDGKKITIQVGAKAVPRNGAYYAPPNPDEFDGHLADRLARLVEVTIDTPDYAHEGGWVHQGQKHAEYYGFRLYDDGRVAEQARWTKGFRHESQIPNILVGIEDIDKIQGYVDSINAGDQHEEQ
jgi:hypothetical protein